jgi:hypothetical protein
MIVALASRRTVLRASAFVFLSVAVFSAQATTRMTPGQWELTTTTKGDSQVLKFCADPATLAIANGDTRSGREALVKLHSKTGCTVGDFKAEGSNVSYTLTCHNRTVQASETYHGDRYEGNLKTKLASGEVDSDYTAHRLGACE